MAALPTSGPVHGTVIEVVDGSHPVVAAANLAALTGRKRRIRVDIVGGHHALPGRGVMRRRGSATNLSRDACEQKG